MRLPEVGRLKRRRGARLRSGSAETWAGCKRRDVAPAAAAEVGFPKGNPLAETTQANGSCSSINSKGTWVQARLWAS